MPKFQPTKQSNPPNPTVQHQGSLKSPQISCEISLTCPSSLEPSGMLSPRCFAAKCCFGTSWMIFWRKSDGFDLLRMLLKWDSQIEWLSRSENLESTVFASSVLHVDRKNSVSQVDCFQAVSGEGFQELYLGPQGPNVWSQTCNSHSLEQKTFAHLQLDDIFNFKHYVHQHNTGHLDVWY